MPSISPSFPSSLDSLVLRADKLNPCVKLASGSSQISQIASELDAVCGVLHSLSRRQPLRGDTRQSERVFGQADKVFLDLEGLKNSDSLSGDSSLVFHGGTWELRDAVFSSLLKQTKRLHSGLKDLLAKEKFVLDIEGRVQLPQPISRALHAGMDTARLIAHHHRPRSRSPPNLAKKDLEIFNQEIHGCHQWREHIQQFLSREIRLAQILEELSESRESLLADKTSNGISRAVIADMFIGLDEVREVHEKFLERARKEDSISDPDQRWGVVFGAFQQRICDAFSKYVRDSQRIRVPAFQTWEATMKARASIEDRRPKPSPVDLPFALLMAPAEHFRKYPQFFEEFSKAIVDPAEQQKLNELRQTFEQCFSTAAKSPSSTDRPQRLHQALRLSASENIGRVKKHGIFAVKFGAGDSVPPRQLQLYLRKSVLLFCEESGDEGELKILGCCTSFSTIGPKDKDDAECSVSVIGSSQGETDIWFVDVDQRMRWELALREHLPVQEDGKEIVLPQAVAALANGIHSEGKSI